MFKPPTTRSLKVAAATALATTVAGASLVLPGSVASAGAKAGIDYEFTFVNGQTISGTATSNTVFVTEAGGMSIDHPTGMTMHVSCSDGFPGGWGEKDGPNPAVDSAWQVAAWSIIKGDKTCDSGHAAVSGGDVDDKKQNKAERKAAKEAEKAAKKQAKAEAKAEKEAAKAAEKANKDAAKAAEKAAKNAEKAAKNAGKDDGISYTLVFENGTVITGTSGSNIAFLPNAGGTSVADPTGMHVHVSCSDDFPDGWGEKDGPDPVIDSAWRVASWSVVKGDKNCTSDGFVPPTTYAVSGEGALDVDPDIQAN